MRIDTPYGQRPWTATCFTCALLLGVVSVAGIASLTAAQVADVAATEGIYTPAQAERGKFVFERRCMTCHNVDLKGNGTRGPALVGEQFTASWQGNLYPLFSKMTQTMPRNSPGSLSAEAAVDVFAYLLQSNQFPAGPFELKPDGLARAVKNAGGPPSAIRNFALVTIVGCLAHSGGAWKLTHTSEPVVTGEQPATAVELRDAAATPLGAKTYRLVSVTAFHPASYRGNKVQAKGLLYRAASEESRLNVTSLGRIAPNCPE